MSKKLLIIMNPVAGTKKANKYLTEIVQMFCDAGYECQLQMTRKDLGADEIVKNHAFNKDLVVCIGGDGTFNEMVSGMITDCKLKQFANAISQTFVTPLKRISVR